MFQKGITSHFFPNRRTRSRSRSRVSCNTNHLYVVRSTFAFFLNQRLNFFVGLSFLTNTTLSNGWCNWGLGNKNEQRNDPLSCSPRPPPLPLSPLPPLFPLPLPHLPLAFRFLISVRNEIQMKNNDQLLTLFTFYTFLSRKRFFVLLFLQSIPLFQKIFFSS